MNPTLEVIAARRSLRRYAERPLSPTEKDAILQATLRAPTAGNQMLYSIIEVEDPALKERLAVTCDNQPFIAAAPWVLLFLADYQRWYDYFQYCGCEERARQLDRAPRRPQEGDLLLACCDALIAAQTAVIAAESLGIGSCYIGDILENYETHRQMFGLPPYAIPVTLLCFGFPLAAHPSAASSRRFPPQQVFFKNTYQWPGPHGLEEMDAELRQRSGKNSPLEEGAENPGQRYYLRKFTADFSVEMSRSVRAILQSWNAGI
jgi:nitroreductase